MICNDKIFGTSEFKRADMLAVQSGMNIKTLMNNAAFAVYKNLIKVYNGKNITIVCGNGNNGGDGYALAVILSNDGFDVTCVAVEEPVSDSAKYYYDEFMYLNGNIIFYIEPETGEINESAATVIADSECIVDAIFGFSFHPPLDEAYDLLINCINESDAFILSIDLPSGILADSGSADGRSVCADVTCTFTANKIATAVFPAREYCGRIFVEDIGLPESIVEQLNPLAYLIGKHSFALHKRRENSHKGSYGTLVELCGSIGMYGAAALAAKSALRSGVGLVNIVAPKEVRSILAEKLDEPIFTEFTDAKEFLKLKASAYLIGCGIGRNYDHVLKDLFIGCHKPKIIDADGINFLSDNINIISDLSGSTVLTPHPGEMARLIGSTVDSVNSLRFETAKEFAVENNVITVLKGAGTVVALPDGKVYINTTGNSGMSKGGSGDVLAGLIASLAAQGYNLEDAAVIGVYIHGLSGDRLAAEYGEYAMLPSDMPLEIGKLLKECSLTDR